MVTVINDVLHSAAWFLYRIVFGKDPHIPYVD